MSAPATPTVPSLGHGPDAIQLDDSLLPLLAQQRYTLRYGIA